jgi:hypothetical protein
LLVLDPEIVADSHHLLAHLVAVAPAARPPELAIILAFVTPFCSSAWHITLSLLVLLLF